MQNQTKIKEHMAVMFGCLHIFGHIVYIEGWLKKEILFLTRESTDNGSLLSSLADFSLAAPQRQNCRQDV